MNFQIENLDNEKKNFENKMMAVSFIRMDICKQHEPNRERMEEEKKTSIFFFAVWWAK